MTLFNSREKLGDYKGNVTRGFYIIESYKLKSHLYNTIVREEWIKFFVRYFNGGVRLEWQKLLYIDAI